MSENKFEVFNEKEIIPSEGIWVSCKGYESFGKIRSINKENKTCIISFFAEYQEEESEGGMEETEVHFKDIEFIITDKKQIEELEKEERQ